MSIKVQNRDDLVTPNENTNNSNTTVNYSEGFIHTIPIIENPSRANRQLYNLARGRALAHGRNYITMEDIPLVIKVVLSTGSIERVLILDLLIANKGTLTTSQITVSMNISNNTAKRTMTEFKGLKMVTMERSDPNKSNSEYRITLNPKFNWFLTDEFKQLREEFKPTEYQDELKTEKTKTTAKDTIESKKCYDENTPCVKEDKNQQTIQESLSEEDKSSESNTTDNSNDNNDNSHRGEIRHSTKEEVDKFLSTNHMDKMGKPEKGDLI